MTFQQGAIRTAQRYRPGGTESSDYVGYADSSG